MALYRAKNEGRNRACIYDAAMDADLSNRKLLEGDLLQAIKNDGLARRLSADRQCLGRYRRRRRGAGALDPSDPRRNSAVALHSDRRAFRPDYRARRMDAAARLPRRQELAGPDDRRQRLAAAIPPLRLRRSGRAHPHRDRFRRQPARTRTHREHAAWQHGNGGIVDAAAQSHRRALRARRFRHRLFEPAVPAALPVRQAQDRFELRALASRRRPTPPLSSMRWSASAAASA